MKDIITEILAAYGFVAIFAAIILIAVAISFIFVYRDEDFQEWKESIDFKEVRKNVKQNLWLMIITGFALTGCTENERAKRFGATATVTLPPNTKFVGATWKESDLWYCHRPALPGELPTTVTLQEQSSFGLVEGKVLFVEK